MEKNQEGQFDELPKYLEGSAFERNVQKKNTLFIDRTTNNIHYITFKVCIRI